MFISSASSYNNQLSHLQINTAFNGIGHLYTPTITNPRDAVVLKWAASEMSLKEVSKK